MKKNNESNLECLGAGTKSNLLTNNQKSRYVLKKPKSKTLESLFTDFDFELENIKNDFETDLLIFLVENYLWTNASQALEVAEHKLIGNIEEMTGGFFANAIRGLKLAVRDKKLLDWKSIDGFMLDTSNKQIEMT